MQTRSGLTGHFRERCDHIAVGTQFDNVHDYFKAHGRWTNSILTLSQMVEIRNSAEREKILAEKFGVSRTTIYDIREGRTYAWVDKLRKEVIGG